MERLQNLLKILEKRDQTIPGLTERIERVKRDIATFSGKPAPLSLDKPKKKKTKIVELEEDE